MSKRIGFGPNVIDGQSALDRHNRTVHLVSRVAPGLSDTALDELAAFADRLRHEEGLPPIRLTARW
ncbi:hypothetical protein [Nocardia pseudobrasiliensis]|uniref:hypothetical protein n=1 Tax=Nocardia pseudobrasiliensis TaxID=45979 RepID=UPI00082D8ACE|nr:hypothetical protein [Nocardia pseudobrasiliensis]